MLSPQQVTELMLAHQLGPESHQFIQTQYRFQIAEAMDLAAGSRILEIGCGQGDMTAVLANAIGPNGKVIAVDPANPSYGAPLSLADSMNHLKSTTLGSRIEFHLNQNPLDADFLNSLPNIDCAVLAHCLWYFPNQDSIFQTLTSLKNHTSKLFIAEWLLDQENPNQHMHHIAATLQGKIASLISNCQANIQSPLSQSELVNIIKSAGWQIQTQTPLDTSGLPDAHWEINCALGLFQEYPEHLAHLAESESRSISQLSHPDHAKLAKPLPAVLIAATA